MRLRSFLSDNLKPSCMSFFIRIISFSPSTLMLRESIFLWIILFFMRNHKKMLEERDETFNLMCPLIYDLTEHLFMVISLIPQTVCSKRRLVLTWIMASKIRSTKTWILSLLASSRNTPNGSGETAELGQSKYSRGSLVIHDEVRRKNKEGE